MNKVFRTLTLLTVILFGALIMNINNTFATQFDMNKGARVELFNLPSTSTFQGFRVITDDGKVVPGFCRDHDTRGIERLRIYQIVGKQRISVTGDAAFHYAHHLKDWESDPEKWHTVMQYCIANSFRHSANPARLGNIESAPPKMGKISGWTVAPTPSTVRIETTSEAGIYRVGPLVLNVIDDAIPFNYETDLRLTVDGVTRGGNVRDASGRALTEIPQGSNTTIYIHFYHDKAPESISGGIRYKSVKYEAWITEWSAVAGQGIRTVETNYEETEEWVNFNIDGDPNIVELNLSLAKHFTPATSGTATFTVTLRNVKSVGNYTSVQPVGTGSASTITLNGLTLGQRNLTNIKPADVTQPVIVEIRETATIEGFDMLGDTIVITLTRDNEIWSMNVTPTAPMTDSYGNVQFDHRDNLKLNGNWLEVVMKNFKEPDEPPSNKLKKMGSDGKVLDVDFNIVPSGDITRVSTGSGIGELKLTWAEEWRGHVTTVTQSVVSPTTSSSSQTVRWRQTAWQEGRIVLTEVEAPPGYKRIEGSITLVVRRTGERTAQQQVNYNNSARNTRVTWFRSRPLYM